LAGVGWGLAAGAGFAVFLIGLHRAGSANDLWPAGIADLAGLATAVVLTKAGMFGLCLAAASVCLIAAGTVS
jgi:hypothetical protein